VPARDASWWQDADRLAERPDAHAIDALCDRLAPDTPLDEAEQQEEMLDGLRALAALASLDALPVVETQHRVIGGDRCHLMTPATLAADQAVPGKVFLTERRLLFAGGRARTWAWHRVRTIARTARAVSLVVAGPSDLVTLHCNTLGDAVTIAFLARRLSGRDERTA
jgi:hypothetical protein